MEVGTEYPVFAEGVSEDWKTDIMTQLMFLIKM